MCMAPLRVKARLRCRRTEIVRRGLDSLAEIRNPEKEA
ncbi:hypothetical protein D1AOALGA4SA_10773 [Olavius algarvensis Delta 1 endosymbiont]|nr:hypothetical protein D1AOALGA4SA_10773 [Olavius algarvensis Delta 1 endosymbiont]